MDNYSLSDLRAAVGDDNGAFGGNGAWWLCGSCQQPVRDGRKAVKAVAYDFK